MWQEMWELSGFVVTRLLTWKTVIFPPSSISKAIFFSLWFLCSDLEHWAYSVIVHACEKVLMERWDSSHSAVFKQGARNHRFLVKWVSFLLWWSSRKWLLCPAVWLLFRFVILVWVQGYITDVSSALHVAVGSRQKCRCCENWFWCCLCMFISLSL